MKKKVFIIPTLEEFASYFITNGFPESLAIRAYKGYEANDWKDSTDKPIVSWKQKCQHVWFTESNKLNASKEKKSNLQTNLDLLKRL